MKFSIIIPVYNTIKYLPRAVESALSQEDTEVILVDDGSTDGSGALCDEYASERVQVFHQENQYVGMARNVGIALARGEYLYFLDSDDQMERGVCAKVRNGTADVLSSTVRYIKNKKTTWQGNKDGAGLFLFSPYLGQSFYKKEWVLSHPPFSAERKTAEDCEWLFSLLQGASVETFDFPFYRYTEGRDGSLCTAYRKSAILPTLETWKRLYEEVDTSLFSDKQALKAYCADALIQHCISACLVRGEQGKTFLKYAEACLPYFQTEGCKIKSLLPIRNVVGTRTFFRLCNAKMHVKEPR